MAFQKQDVISQPKFTLNWSALTGSSTQIKWADEIRKRFSRGTVKDAVNGLQGVLRRMPSSQVDELKFKAWIILLPLVNQHTNAKWWIENRDNLGEFFAEFWDTFLN